MFQDKTAFLEYPSRYVRNYFDSIQVDFHLERARAQIDMVVYNGSQEVAKFNAHVPTERLFEQYVIEQAYAEQHNDKGIRHEIRLHGAFPHHQQN